MSAKFSNVYDDQTRANAYAKLEFPGTYNLAYFAVMETYRPLGESSEPYAWVSETKISPWVIYVLRHGEEQQGIISQGEHKCEK